MEGRRKREGGKVRENKGRGGEACPEEMHLCLKNKGMNQKTINRTFPSGFQMSGV